MVQALSCHAIVGPANNQLSDPAVADPLHAKVILWAPDFVANAGGAILSAVVDLDGGTMAQALARADGIGARLEEVFDLAEAQAITPYTAAMMLAERRLAQARPIQ